MSAAPPPMELGMVGLGRMGANLVRRLLRDGHRCVVHDVDPLAVERLTEEGATGTRSLEELVGALRTPRTVWVMVPAGHVDPVVDDLAGLLSAGDVVVDGGNSHHDDDRVRAARLDRSGVHYVDCGTSGGVRGLERGYCLMIGGDPEPVARLDAIWRSLAPGEQAAPPTPGRTTRESTAGESTAQKGYLHCGPVGAGHFVKMVHNGIEYGMMAALAEGLSMLEHADVGRRPRTVDAETTPLRDPGSYHYDLDVGEVAELWRRGSVIDSWLVDLAAEAYARSGDLEEFDGRVSDSGEGRWAVMTAVEQGVPAPVISAALTARFESRGHGSYAGRVLSALRAGFGGHLEPEP